MKILNKSLRILLSLAVVAALMFIYSCGGDTDPDPDPEPTAGELAVINLTNSAWKVNSVAVDGVDKSTMFTNLSITFTPSSTLNGKPNSFNGSFTSVNGGAVWPSSGSWTITDPSEGKNLQRGDAVSIQLTEVTATSLKMSLAWNKTTFGTGRVGSLKGQHVFTMGK